MAPMFDTNVPLSTYEQATLALQQAGVDATLAGVAAQQAGNDIAFWVGITQAAVALSVGLIQAGVVGWGIWYMIRMGERREQQHADRHTETMEALRQQGEALRTLIERTAPQPAART